MPGPLIVVAGSVDQKRTDYNPPITQPKQAKQAAEEIGAELAKQGCRIIVYSSSPNYVEVDAVRGFTAAAPKGTESAVQVRFPLGDAAAEFPHSEAQAKLFQYHADSNTDWEASFYQSLRDADGVLLIGGAQSVLVTGHIALGYRIPLLALPQFGGASHKIWRTVRPGHDLMLEDEKQIMGHPTWETTSATDCVRMLLAQYDRRQTELSSEIIREREVRRRINGRAVLAILFFLAALATLPMGLSQGVSQDAFVALLYFSGPLAGAAGSMIRSIWAASEPDRAMLQTIALGVVAGGTSAVLFLLAQLSSGAAASPKQPTALVFSVAIGFVAGFTSDRVFKKLAEADVARLDLVSGKRRK
jgi:hypothetical protein